MEDPGKSLAEAEGLIEAESNTNKPHPNEFCLNCGPKLIDTCCHHCGQKDIPRRQALGDLLSNIISSFTSYEGKFLQTAKFLFSNLDFLRSNTITVVANINGNSIKACLKHTSNMILRRQQLLRIKDIAGGNKNFSTAQLNRKRSMATIVMH